MSKHMIAWNYQAQEQVLESLYTWRGHLGCSHHWKWRQACQSGSCALRQADPTPALQWQPASTNLLLMSHPQKPLVPPHYRSAHTRAHTHTRNEPKVSNTTEACLFLERDCQTPPSQHKLGIGICKTAYLEVSIWYQWTWREWNHMDVLLPGSEGSCWMHCFEPGTWWPGCSPPYLHWHWRPCQPKVSHPSLTASLLHPTWRFPLHHSLQVVVQSQETTPRDLYNPASKKPAHETHNIKHPSQTSNYPIQ